MAALQKFRTALNGFNREDVVHYIEYINNLHASQVNQLKTELQALQEELAALKAAEPVQDLSGELAEAKATIEALEQELSVAREEAQQAQNRPHTESELEAYRRAERAERVANERVSQLYSQANGVLADATVRTDEAATRVAAAADSIAAQLSELQAALVAGRNTMKDAAAAMYAVKPLEEN